MKRYPFEGIITSTPRSGTKYISTLLNEVGCGTSHERYHRWYNHYLFSWKPRYTEVSWCAAGELDRLKAYHSATPVLHQVRHPVDTINSLLFTRQMLWNQNVNWRVNGDGWVRYKLDTFERLGWEMPLEHVAATQEFWWRWHWWIDRWQSFRYRIEDVDEETVNTIAAYLGRKPHDVAKKLESIPKNKNSVGEVPAVIGWKDLTPKVRQLAESYGYKEQA